MLEVRSRPTARAVVAVSRAPKATLPRILMLTLANSFPLASWTTNLPTTVCTLLARTHVAQSLRGALSRKLLQDDVGPYGRVTLFHQGVPDCCTEIIADQLCGYGILDLLGPFDHGRIDLDLPHVFQHTSGVGKDGEGRPEQEQNLNCSHAVFRTEARSILIAAGWLSITTTHRDTGGFRCKGSFLGPCPSS